MKISVFVLVAMTLLIAAPAFAGDFAAGGGVLFGGESGGGIEASGGGAKATIKFPYGGAGAFAFVDIKFLEASVGYFGGSGDAKVFITGQGTVTGDIDMASFNFSALGKYPFTINERIRVFPMAGIDYQLVTKMETENEPYTGVDANTEGEETDFSALWFRFGVGGDFFITRNIFVRADMLYGIRLANKVENDLEDALSAAPSVEKQLGHGFWGKVGVGYKF
jgi:hypothetical protein